MRGVIEEHYRVCDGVLGRALVHADEETLFIGLSDHGFTSFQRGFNVNTWLYENGLLALQPGAAPGEAAEEFFRGVDWGRTRAYAVGIGSIYLNRAGREVHGIVPEADVASLTERIARGLTGVPDPGRGQVAVRGVATRQEVYSGPYAAESPDLVVLFNAGYRASWATALGGLPRGVFEDNVKRWSGDHIVDPELVPGVLFMNRPFHGDRAALVDLAPTILSALGVPAGPAMEGNSLLP
jgi:predicted AlkP superfamily phosphohydrolase/phosphomutase